MFILCDDDDEGKPSRFLFRLSTVFIVVGALALVTIHCCEVMGPAQKIRFCTVDGVRWSLEMDHVHRCITSYSSIPAKWGRVRWHFDNRNVSMWGMLDGGLFFATTVTTRSPFPYFLPLLLLRVRLEMMWIAI